MNFIIKLHIVYILLVIACGVITGFEKVDAFLLGYFVLIIQQESHHLELVDLLKENSTN